MNLSKTLQEYLTELSSNSPTPGGGNVAALCGALSASLGTMVGNLTIGKKKYANVENEMISVKQKLESYQKTFVELGAKDNAAFEKVMEAFKLPKETDAEKESRSKKIEEATIGAADIPAQVMKTCADILPLLKIIIDKGNRNSLSDAGVAASLIGTAAKSAYLNVIINCSSLSNQTIAQEIKKRADVSIEEISRSSDFLVEQVVKAIQPA
ncbi:MAG: cyclodeaminase/cyclohydrolase family protein [Bacteroidota bacterium]